MNYDRRKILIVIHDELLAELTEFRLSLLGYDTHVVRDGNTAVELVESSPPDLLIVCDDIQDIGYIDLVNVIRNRSVNSHVPLIVFSIDAELETVQRAFFAGANDYIITPYDPATLEAKIEDLLVTELRSHEKLAKS